MAVTRAREVMLLDSAIDVLATGGIRQLTHRAVDAAAGVPEGSTSNGFRTRESLLAAVLGRLLELETSVWAEVAADAVATDSDTFAACLGQVIGSLTGENRKLSQARRAVFTEALHHPSLTEEIQRGRGELTSWLEPLLSELGSLAPSRDVEYLLALIDGFIGLKLSNPDAATPDAAPAIAALLRGLNGTLTDSMLDPHVPSGRTVEP